MAAPNDPHDARFEERRMENLVLLAFGESADDWFEAHRAACPQCQREVNELSETVRLGREITDIRTERMPAPPAAVWDAIARELDFDVARPAAVLPLSQQASPPATPTVPSERPARRRPARTPDGPFHWRVGLAAAAVIVALVGAAGIGVGIGRSSSHPVSASVLSKAQLAPLSRGLVSVQGAATVTRSAGRLSLVVDTSGLPLRQGYYQVWLFDPKANRRVPIGVLGGNGAGDFTLPNDVDLRSYDVIDVSAQDFDANNGQVVHNQSVLRGPLTQ